MFRFVKAYAFSTYDFFPFFFTVSIGIFKERTPPRTVQLSMPNTQSERSQPSDLPEVSRFQTSMAIDSIGTELGIARAEITRLVSAEEQVDDQLKSFLPPPATTKCPGELQVFLAITIS